MTLLVPKFVYNHKQQLRYRYHLLYMLGDRLCARASVCCSDVAVVANVPSLACVYRPLECLLDIASVCHVHSLSKNNDAGR